MKAWQRRTIGLLAICGSTIAIASLPGVLTKTHGFGLALALLPTVAYIFGIWCGVAILENSSHALKVNQIFWALQIPVLKSPYVGYALASGAYWQINVQLNPFNISTQWYLGTDYLLYFNRPDAPWLIGVNLVALAIFIFLSAQEQSEVLSNPATGDDSNSSGQSEPAAS